MNSVEVCLTPELIHQHELTGKTVVVVDIFRATSCIVTGLAFGVRAIVPVSKVDECLELGSQGMITAGERDGKKVKQFDIGNSPFDYQNHKFIDREVAITTTNGTIAIEQSQGAAETVIGSFLNLRATADYLKGRNQDIVIHCAGWKGNPNIEDTLFAGALIEELGYNIDGDSAIMAADLYQRHKGDLLTAAQKSGHARRLAGFGVEKDIVFCMKFDEYNEVVRLDGKRLVKVSD